MSALKDQEIPIEAMKEVMLEKPVKLNYIPHPLLQDGFGYFICEEKNCKQQIVPMVDIAMCSLLIKDPKYPHRQRRLAIQAVRCRKCGREYMKEELERLAKKKKLLRAVAI